MPLCLRFRRVALPSERGGDRVGAIRMHRRVQVASEVVLRVPGMKWARSALVCTDSESHGDRGDRLRRSYVIRASTVLHGIRCTGARCSDALASETRLADALSLIQTVVTAALHCTLCPVAVNTKRAAS